MSTLGSLSGQIEREEERLRELNLALIALEAQSFGHTADFGLSKEDIEKSRQLLADFIVRFRGALDQESPRMDVQSLVHRVKSGIKPIEDWREDLDALATQLQTKETLKEEILPVLEDVLSLLDTEFTEDLRRLYNR